MVALDVQVDVSAKLCMATQKCTVDVGSSMHC